MYGNAYGPLYETAVQMVKNKEKEMACLKDVKTHIVNLDRLRYELSPPEFDDVIKVLQHSAESGKYGENDWLNGINFDSIKNIASLQRHVRDYRLGNRIDKDNGLHPLLMVACRALMQYTLDTRELNKK